jgi:hypothetical protein
MISIRSVGVILDADIGLCYIYFYVDLRRWLE